MDLSEFLQKLCKHQQEIFSRSFGDPNISNAALTTLPVDSSHAWKPVMVMSAPCLLVIRNMSAADEVEYTFNDRNIVGTQVKKDTYVVLENIRGTLYLRPVDSTKSIQLNVSATALHQI